MGKIPSDDTLHDIIAIDGKTLCNSLDKACGTTMYDTLRTKDLENLGFRVLQVGNHEVFINIGGVMDSILNLLESVSPESPHPQPFSLEGEGSAPCQLINFSNQN